MTKMLASVTGPDEAAIVLAAGADLIDLKDPARGALGAVSVTTIRETIEFVAGRRAVSAVAGDLPMEPDVIRAAVGSIVEAGAQYAKIGVFPGGDPAACIEALAGMSERASLVAVFFADTGLDLTLLPKLKECGFSGAMLDTHGKLTGRLLDHMPMPPLRAFVERCRTIGLMSGLAGSLETPDIPRLLVLAPDLLGFRGALCGAAGRSSAIDMERVRIVRALIPLESESRGAPEVDYRLLAARGYAPGDDAPTDTVFVHDLVLPARIGAYARERTALQLVRFDVEAEVVRAGHSAEDMRDVFSYDVIIDGIQMLIDAGHVALVETLAERTAAMALAHPRVVKVSVRLQKLETGRGTVGVRIERARAKGRSATGVVLPIAAETGRGV